MTDNLNKESRKNRRASVAHNKKRDHTRKKTDGKLREDKVRLPDWIIQDLHNILTDEIISHLAD